MSDNEEYNLGYFEGVRAIFLMWQNHLLEIKHEDGTLEMQLQSVEFVIAMTDEMKEALKLRDER